MYPFMTTTEQPTARTSLEEIESHLEHERNRIEAALREQELLREMRSKLEAQYAEDQPLSIALQVASAFQIPFHAMMGRTRPEWIAFPRQVAMFLVYEITDMSLQAVGNYFGGRDHGTVHHAIRAVKNRMETCTEVRNQVERIRSIYAAKPPVERELDRVLNGQEAKCES